jgi:DNA repair exonuclease SbcCD ATPase subunit
MIGPLKILVCFFIIIGICTLISGLLWYNNEPLNRENSRMFIEDFMTKYQADKQSLGELKEEKTSLKHNVKKTGFNEIIVVYDKSDNKTLIIESYINNDISKISYDIDRDGKMDIFEFFLNNNDEPYSREYDINRDGIIDIIEKDSNYDGVLSIDELKFNIEGQFIPFTTINGIIM